MLTRCPTCTTTFRVTPEQLKAKAGKVRCGECQSVFNALDTLIEEALVADLPAPPDPEPAASSMAMSDDVAVPPEPISDPPPPTTGEPAATGPVEAPEPLPPPIESVFEPEPLLHEDEPAPARRWPWVLGGLTALLVLGIQALLQFRVEIAVMHPGWRPQLEALCDVAGCVVGLPRKVELVGIDSSDLHPESGPPGRLRLIATLRNRAPFAQEFPHLELTLTDAADKALVRRVLAPADYLPKKANPETGIAASGDQSVSLLLEAIGLPAAGYRLYLFYP